MTEWLRILLELGGLAISGGLGAWILTAWRYRAEREDRRSQTQVNRERTLVAEYQHILDDKDQDLGRLRVEWRAERDRLEKEAAQLRRSLQTDLIDMESMRVRIAGLNQEISRLTGVDRQALGDLLDSVVFTDDRGDIYWANELASEFLRQPIERLYQMNVRELVPKSLRAMHERGMERLRQRGPQPRGAVTERAIRGRALRGDGVEIPADITLNSFTVRDTIVCRAQIRIRFVRPEGDLYVPASASSSGVATVPTTIVDAGGAAEGTGAAPPPAPVPPPAPPDGPSQKRFR